MTKKKKDKLSPAEEAAILNAEDATYPCLFCDCKKPCAVFKTCWKYRTWFRLKWREVTSVFKKKG